jgi:hypothetical protein
MPASHQLDFCALGIKKRKSAKYLVGRNAAFSLTAERSAPYEVGAQIAKVDSHPFAEHERTGEPNESDHHK